MKTYIFSYKVPFKLYLIVLLLSLFVKSAFGQSVILNEDKYNSIALIQFVQQLESTDISIGIIGDNYNLLANLSKQLKEKGLEAKVKLLHFSSTKDVTDCDVYFVTNDYRENLTQIVANSAISKYHPTRYKIYFDKGESKVVESANASNFRLSAS